MSFSRGRYSQSNLYGCAFGAEQMAQDVSVSSATGKCIFRVDGREHRIRRSIFRKTSSWMGVVGVVVRYVCAFFASQ